jgi:hypothetical protein
MRYCIRDFSIQEESKAVYVGKILLGSCRAGRKVFPDKRSALSLLPRICSRWDRRYGEGTHDLLLVRLVPKGVKKTWVIRQEVLGHIEYLDERTGWVLGREYATEMTRRKACKAAKAMMEPPSAGRVHVALRFKRGAKPQQRPRASGSLRTRGNAGDELMTKDELNESIDEYFWQKSVIHEAFAYEPDWVEIPLDDMRGHHWMLVGGEAHGGKCVYSEKPFTKETIAAGEEISSGDIYTQRFLTKWVYRTEGHVLVSVDTKTDMNRFLMIFDAELECTDQELRDLYAERWGSI